MLRQHDFRGQLKFRLCQILPCIVTKSIHSDPLDQLIHSDLSHFMYSSKLHADTNSDGIPTELMKIYPNFFVA